MNRIQRLITNTLDAACIDLDRTHRARENTILLARNLGLTHAQIGAQLGLTETAVRYHLKHAQKEIERGC